MHDAWRHAGHTLTDLCSFACLQRTHTDTHTLLFNLPFLLCNGPVEGRREFETVAEAKGGSLSTSQTHSTTHKLI